MCGIIGYVGKMEAPPILIEGLRRLEYRGYDSAGLAVVHEGKLQVRKKQGKIDEGLARLLEQQPVVGSIGIGHTRWATHGPPSDTNSHPHLDQSGTIAVVHNGVIENYDRLKEKLLKAGHTFRSDTDTEILAHLIGHYYQQERGPVRPQSERGGAPNSISARREPMTGSRRNGIRRSAAAFTEALRGRDVESHPLVRAVCAALREVIGTYGVAIISKEYPNLLIGARHGSPLILGIGAGDHFLTSDANAIVAHTAKVVYLNDFDVAIVTSDRFEVFNLQAHSVPVQISQLSFGSQETERGEFAHYMLKEIFEQPKTVENALRGRVDRDAATAKFGGLNMTTAELQSIKRIIIAASGTSWHAALVGEYLIENFARLPVEVEFAHEFCYRSPPLEKNTVLLVISQSGETADTLAALREAKRRGHRTLAIVNVIASTIAREAGGGIYMHAGPEIGVASTKAFMSMLAILALLALYLGRLRKLPLERGAELLDALAAIPAQIGTLLAQSEALKQLAIKYAAAQNFFFLGRGYTFPIALEGALKLKEISYIHAEGYSAAEMKHGPIALIDSNTPSVFLVPQDSLYSKTMANLAMIRARKGPLIAVASEGDREIAALVDDAIYLPRTLDPLYPLLAIVPLQLLAYHMAVSRGCDVDKPRNLAKSVTVE